MFRSDKRNQRTVASINTLIAAGTTIRGDVHFTGGLHLDGTIEGSIAAEGADAAAAEKLTPTAPSGACPPRRLAQRTGKAGSAHAT